MNDSLETSNLIVDEAQTANPGLQTNFAKNGFVNKPVFSKINEIIVGNRLRGMVSAKVDELAESIAAVGLTNFPTVLKT